MGSAPATGSGVGRIFLYSQKAAGSSPPTGSLREAPTKVSLSLKSVKNKFVKQIGFCFNHHPDKSQQAAV